MIAVFQAMSLTQPTAQIFNGRLATVVLRDLNPLMWGQFSRPRQLGGLSRTEVSVLICSLKSRDSPTKKLCNVVGGS